MRVRCYKCGRFASSRYRCKICGHSGTMDHYHLLDQEADRSPEGPDVLLIVNAWTFHLRAANTERVYVHSHPFEAAREGHHHPQRPYLQPPTPEEHGYRWINNQLCRWDDDPAAEFGQVWIPVCLICTEGPIDPGEFRCTRHGGRP